ncbi:MAG TPA: capsule assembly Wzi family protein [Prolixibacteraceae bacterium]|nr:capsule assembly Wzi family protein [Prolixibacteraceae bacterium]
MKEIILFLFLWLPLLSYSQEASLRTTFLAGSDDQLPFWMTHNQLGRFATQGSWQQLTEGTLSGATPLRGQWSLSYGAHLGLLISPDGADPKIIQSYLALTGNILRLQAGAFADEEIMGGLSSSNGDLMRSLNYRPYPRVRLSTPGYIPVFFAPDLLEVKAEYTEGLLPGPRSIDRPHLHHKSFMMRWNAHRSLKLALGLNHYVFWGGHSERLGKLPSGFRDYLAYVTGGAGNANFVETEQQNVAGNHLGSYLFTAQKDFNSYSLQLNISHPFEDGSGMGFDNLKDNLYTLHWRSNNTGRLLEEFLIEYLYSKHQSGDRRLEVNVPEEHKRGNDNYFNHGIYRTGFTYLGQSMGTPLFMPLAYNPQGVIVGVANNRVSAFHAGAKGSLSKALTWKAMATLSRNFGTWRDRYPEVREQLYSIASLTWKSPRLPLQLSAQTGVDSGGLSRSVGVGLSGVYRFK